MSEYRRVLIPVDLMPERQMAPAVRRIVDPTNAEITLLHVVESQPWDSRARHTLRLMNELEILAHHRFKGARLVRRVEWGRPADCILNVLRNDRLELVFMGAENPVTAEVLADAPCPVLLEWASAPPINHVRTHPVCCAVELNGNEARVVREAARVAAGCAAPLILISAAPVAPVRPSMLWSVAERNDAVSALQNRLDQLREQYAPDATIVVETGNPEIVIARALRYHGASILVAAPSQDAIRAADSQCPVLAVPELRSRELEAPLGNAAMQRLRRVAV